MHMIYSHFFYKNKKGVLSDIKMTLTMGNVHIKKHCGAIE